MRVSLFLLLFLLVSNPLNAKGIPDSIISQVEMLEGEAKLTFWSDWIRGNELKEKVIYLEAFEIACNLAKGILEEKEAIFWCSRHQIRMAHNLAYAGLKKEAGQIFEKERKIVDELAEDVSYKKELLSQWYLNFGRFLFRLEEIDKAEENLLSALEINKELKNDGFEFHCQKELGLFYGWINRIDEAVNAYRIAEDILRKDTTIDRSYIVGLQYNLALLYGKMEKQELGLQYFERALSGISNYSDNLSQDFKERINMDYAYALCTAGQSIKGMRLLEIKEPEIYARAARGKVTFFRYLSECAIINGDKEGALKYSKKLMEAIDEETERRRDKELLEIQTKFDAKAKEDRIKKLEQEKLVTRTQTKLRISLIALIGFLGIAILSFVLLKNRNRQKQLALINQRDQEIADNRNRLFSSITHDIRTPLALMMAPLERAESKLKNTTAISDIQLAQRNGKRLMDLFNQILDWNKAEANAMLLNNQVGQLNLTFDNLLVRFFQQAKEGNIIFRSDLNLPAGQYSLDFDKLDKILSNLMGNAIKFCEDEDEVFLMAKLKDHSTLMLEVRDTGPGISEIDRQNIFNRYYQGEQGKLKGGTGIGLALVKELLGLMNGTIRLESAEGKGTQFFIQLPISQARNIAFETEEHLTTEVGEIARTEKPLVLVVEDEPELLDFLKSALVGKYEVEKANLTAVGYSLAVSRVPDIIISDWNLPDNNGGWLCRQLRDNPITSHIPTIILTAFSSDTHQQAAFDAGAVAWLNKPFKLETLHRQLKTILDQQLRAQKQWSQNNNTTEALEESLPSMDPFLEKVMERIQKNIGEEDYTIEKMAQQLNLSRVQLFRKVKSLTGSSPSKLLLGYRLTTARKLLRQTNNTVSEIAYSVGFVDPNYFSRAYKKHFEVSPSEDQS